MITPARGRRVNDVRREPVRSDRIRPRRSLPGPLMPVAYLRGETYKQATRPPVSQLLDVDG